MPFQKKQPNATATLGEVIIKLKKPIMAQPQAFSAYKDDNTGEVITFKDANGKPSTITFTTPITKLHRDIPRENRIIEFMLEYRKSSSWQKRGRGLTIEDKVVDAKSKNLVREQRNQAEIEVGKYITEGKITDLGYLLGVYTKLGVKDAAKMDKEVLKNEIFTILDNDPDKVYKAVTNQDKDFVLTFHKGVAKGIFKLAENSMFKYNASPMGVDESACVLWLKNNADVYAALKPEIDA